MTADSAPSRRSVRTEDIYSTGATPGTPPAGDDGPVSGLQEYDGIDEFGDPDRRPRFLTGVVASSVFGTVVIPLSTDRIQNTA